MNPVNESSAVRTGLPLRTILLRMLLPGAVLVLVAVFMSSIWVRNRIENEAWTSLQTTVRAVFDSHAAVRGNGNGLSILARNSGLERIWVVDATGRILDASRPNETGRPLDDVWWDAVRDMEGSLLLERLPYGRSEVVMVAVRDASLGRLVVAVGPVPDTGTKVLFAVLSILGLSLTLWLVLAVSVWFVVGRRLQFPLSELDRRLLSIIRGDALTDAALDQTLAVTEPLLGGHASCTVDVARRALSDQRRGVELEARFDALFGALPALSIIVRRDGTVLAANRRVSLRSEKVATLQDMVDLFPVGRIRVWLDRLGDEGAGMEDILLADGSTLSLQPIRWEDRPAVMVTLVEGWSDQDIQPETEEVPYRMVLEASGMHAVVFDEEGGVLYATPGLASGDLRQFRAECLATAEDRDAFDAWMHERPDLRSQVLSLKIDGRATGPLEWHATEIASDGHEAGLLWAHPAAPVAGEPETP